MWARMSYCISMSKRARWPSNSSPSNQRGIVRRHNLERTSDLRTVRSNLLPRSLGHVPLVLDQLTAKVLLQTDQGTFSVHPSLHRTRQFRESLQVHEARIVCVNILGRQSGPPPFVEPIWSVSASPRTPEPPNARPRTGPFMEAEATEFVLTAGIVALHVHAPPCPTYGYEARRVSASTCSVLLSLRGLPPACLSTTSKSQLVRRGSGISTLQLMALSTEEILKKHSRAAAVQQL